MSGIDQPYRYQYETIAVSQTDQDLGGTGAAGDYLHRLVVNVATAATSAVTLKDGATAIMVIPANTTIGVYSLELNLRASTGPWKITTGAGATVVAVGIFSA